MRYKTHMKYALDPRNSLRLILIFPRKLLTLLAVILSLLQGEKLQDKLENQPIAEEEHIPGSKSNRSFKGILQEILFY